MARGYATLYGFGSAEPMGTDESLAPIDGYPQESSSGSWWNRISDVAKEIVSNAPVVVERVPDAYAAYEAGGRGVEGALAIFPVFGPQTTPQKPIPSVSVLPTASQVAAQEEGWGLPVSGTLLAGAAAIGGLLWYFGRKKR